jgi:hypothetical protein
MTSCTIQTFDASSTAALLNYGFLVAALAESIVEYSKGEVTSPNAWWSPSRKGA